MALWIVDWVFGLDDSSEMQKKKQLIYFWIESFNAKSFHKSEEINWTSFSDAKCQILKILPNEFILVWKQISQFYLK